MAAASSSNDVYDSYGASLAAYNEEHALAEEMVPLVGKLYRENSLVCTVFGNGLVNGSVMDILKVHKSVRHLLPAYSSGLSVSETLPLVRAMLSLGSELGPSRVDLGKLSVLYRTEHGAAIDGSNDDAVAEFVRKHAAPVLGSGPLLAEGKDVVLYGFGRIGRLVARVLLGRIGSGDALVLRAIVVRPHMDEVDDLHKRASLLRRDSTHGKFKGMISVDEEARAIVVNGVRIQVIYSGSPGEIDYTQYGINDAIVIDNTGKWRDEAGLGLHLQSKGVGKVVLTAPAKGGIPNIVMGVNSEGLDIGGQIYAAASCTTNAVCPPLVVLGQAFSIEAIHIETIHAFTNDQNLLDNFHKKERRGRSAPLNLVLTETGAAKAVAAALPQYAGKITGSAIRCPTPNVSLAILILTLDRETTAEEINEILREASIRGPLQRQIGFSNSREAASTDMVGSRATCVIDAPSTIVKGTRVNLYCWYDNEFGYSVQVARLVQTLAGVHHPQIPVEFEFSDSA